MLIIPSDTAIVDMALLQRTLLLETIRHHLYEWLSGISAEDLKCACRSLHFDAAEEDLLLVLYPTAKQLTKEQFDLLFLEKTGSTPAEFDFFGWHQSETEQQNAAGNLSRLLDGARIALVGPSVTVLGSAQRQYLESFDFIARINFQWPVPHRLVPDIGSRMDILYHCCNGDRPITAMLIPDFNQTRFVCYQENIESIPLRKYCLRHAIPHLDISSTYQQLSASAKTSVNTGFVAIEHLCQFAIKELYVTGITFFKTPYYEGYPGHGNNRKYWKNSLTPDKIGPHSFEPQLEQFARRLSSDERVRTDRWLAGIVEKCRPARSGMRCPIVAEPASPTPFTL
ncbi:MAG TPA: hypothetical protein PLP17_10930 [Oligoflexia bacterium]|nr:hypothetical protein [Oligoflexia bacterium]